MGETGEASLGVSLLSRKWLAVTQYSVCQHVTRKQSEQGVSCVGCTRFRNRFD